MLGDPDTPLAVSHDSNRITQRDRWRKLLEGVGGCVEPCNLARDLTNPAVYVPDGKLKSGVTTAVTVWFWPGASVKEYVESEISDLVVK